MTVETTMTEQQTAAEIVEIYPPDSFMPDTLNLAINRTLQETERIAWSVIPTIQNEKDYSLQRFPWIEFPLDIKLMGWRLSPNLVDNESFEWWGDGTTSALNRWVFAGASGTVTRIEGSREGYAARLTRSGTDVTLTQTIGLLNGQLRGEALSASVLCTTSTAASASLRISDGVNTTTSTAHTGGGTEETLTVSHTVADTATTLEVSLRFIDNNATADFDLAIVVQTTPIPSWLADDGSTAGALSAIKPQPNVFASSGTPLIHLHHPLPCGNQIYIASSQPYYPLTSDTAVTDMPLQAVIAGTIFRLASDHWPNLDRTRADRLMALWGPRATQWEDLLGTVTGADFYDQRVIVQGA
jgi:hypothetical protein